MSEPDEFNFERSLAAAQLKLRQRTPFFATLALFANASPTTSVPTAATDGKDLYFNVEYFRELTPDQRAGLLLHEVLHAALLHIPRRGSRDAELWNIAADVVVNGIVVKEAQLEIPPNGVRQEKLEHLSVEEVYHKLLTDDRYRDLIRQFSPLTADLLEVGLGGELAEARRAVLEAHWRQALQQAETLNRLNQQGASPAGLKREVEALRAAQFDWRSYLWRFLVHTPTDFGDYDRRFIARGYYFEDLRGESVRVAVCVDTSGSIGGKEMQTLLSEVQGILSAYPHTRCDLYYADANLHGPYPLTARDPIPPPLGGGGTDFRPFFSRIDEDIRKGDAPAACVYLTDGFGTFPSQPPDVPVLWVITNGGMALNAVPFGEAARLLEP
jgi:predicted metal-dependent peptidase